MSIVVLDTDVWSFLFKQDSRAEQYRSHIEGHILAISFQTVAELYQWAEINNWGEKRRGRLQQWLTRFQIVGFDLEMARIWAWIRAQRAEAGRPLAAQDAWVAACALRYGHVLLTHNASDYEYIPDLKVISEAMS